MLTCTCCPASQREREREMGSKDKSDQIEITIQQLNQLETLQGDTNLRQLEPPADAMEPSSNTKSNKEVANNNNNNDKSMNREDDETRAIIKHLKDIKRQNFITQCLVSAMIMLTLTWQLSEVSLFLKVKNRISHPFKSFKDMFGRAMKEQNWNFGKHGDKPKSPSSDQQENEGNLVPTIKLPELPILGIENDEK